MELTSLIGFILGLSVVGYGIHEAGIGTSIFNLHGIIVVLCGTMASVVFHCDRDQIRTALIGVWRVFRSNPYRNPQALIETMSTVAATAKQKGVVAGLQSAPRDVVDGFLHEAVDVATDNINNPDLVRTLLERRVNAARIKADESVNVFRVASVLSPMFGLIGTLLGIIQVLKNISDPTAVGGAMALAISSALFGIAMANIVFVPIAGKLRSINMDQNVARVLVVDGILQIVQGEIPMVIEQRLWSLIQSEKKI